MIDTQELKGLKRIVAEVFQVDQDNVKDEVNGVPLDRALGEAMASFGTRSRQVLLLHFVRGVTLKSIGELMVNLPVNCRTGKMGISPERIRQIKCRLLRMLRAPSKSAKLREFAGLDPRPDPPEASPKKLDTGPRQEPPRTFTIKTTTQPRIGKWTGGLALSGLLNISNATALLLREIMTTDPCWVPVKPLDHKIVEQEQTTLREALDILLKKGFVQHVECPEEYAEDDVYFVPEELYTPTVTEKKLELQGQDDLHVDELELSVRTHHCLVNAELYRISDILPKNEREMLSVKNMGRKSVNELKGVLQNMGLDWPGT